MKTKTIPAIHHRLLALAVLLLALAPGRAAADPAAIFLSNVYTGTVPAYSATGAAATGYTAPAGFMYAEGVAYNPANNTLYVADYNTSKLRTFNASTGTETQLGFASAAGLRGPLGLALNAGVLYAANFLANTVTAYNAATGQTVTSGFTSPAGLGNPGLGNPFGLAVGGTTLFVTTGGNNGTLYAFNLATGTAAADFTTITGLSSPDGVALFGNDLFVANSGSDVANANSNTVGEYNATTGAVINANFVTGLSGPYGLAILGDRLLVANYSGNTVGAYGIPALATLNNVPTSSNASFLTGLSGPAFIAVVPEPSTWALLGLGIAGLGVAALRQRRALTVRRA